MTGRGDAVVQRDIAHESDRVLDPARGIGRRRALRLFAAAAGVGFPGLAQAGAKATAGGDASLWRWQGTALGAQAELAVAHAEPATAKRLVGLALNEVEQFPGALGCAPRRSPANRLISVGSASVAGLIWRQSAHENRQNMSWKLT